MAAARPVVITPRSAHGLGFEDGVHGVVGSTPSELGHLAVELLGDRLRSEELARAGRMLADTYRWERATEQAESLYRDWLTNEADAGTPRPFCTSTSA